MRRRHKILRGFRKRRGRRIRHYRASRGGIRL